MANSSKNGLTGVDGQLKRLLVKFSEAVFLAQPPPKDIHKFAEEYFTKVRLHFGLSVFRSVFN